MQQIIFAFDIAGTIIFAITGAVSGVRLRLDLLGVVVFACTVGVGGGILRDTIIGAAPVAALQNETYLICCIAAGLAVFFCAKYIENHQRIILICDAIGLGVFTAIGAAKGDLYGLGTVGMILCGVLSAVGGGILRDVMSRKIPDVLTSDFYATASLIGGLAYCFLRTRVKDTFLLFCTVTLLVIGIRCIAAFFRIRLPVAGEGGRKGKN